MHRNEIFYGLICINNHVLSCLISMLSLLRHINECKRIRNQIILKLWNLNNSICSKIQEQSFRWRTFWFYRKIWARPLDVSFWFNRQLRLKDNSIINVYKSHSSDPRWSARLWHVVHEEYAGTEAWQALQVFDQKNEYSGRWLIKTLTELKH